MLSDTNVSHTEVSQSNPKSVADQQPVYSSPNKAAKKTKVSTAVGPSPPREIVKSVNDGAVQTYDTVQVTNGSMSVVNDDRKRKVSTGTSPPPQNMSTQVGYVYH